MLLDYLRLLIDTGTIADKSLDNQDDSVTTTIALTSSHYIYVAQRFPFANLFYHLHSANSNASVLSAQYWDGTAWRDVVDMLDGTSSSGACFAKSGIIQFSLNKDYGWQPVIDTTDSNAPTELSSFVIYDSYWIRLKVSSSLTGSTAFKQITYAFTSSQELKKKNVEIDSFFSSFASGKTDWNQEIITASKMLVTDLRRMGLIVAPGQIIELNDVYLPTTFKALELIYENLGPSYKDRLEMVRKDYSESLNIRRFTFDTDQDGKLEHREIAAQVRRLVR